ncbi:MAG: hypothetical protein HY286_06105 [Planctomycetes bacterium]|nr:hypothetical protein [Planctomycetota bacterium]
MEAGGDEYQSQTIDHIEPHGQLIKLILQYKDQCRLAFDITDASTREIVNDYEFEFREDRDSFGRYLWKDAFPRQSGGTIGNFPAAHVSGQIHAKGYADQPVDLPACAPGAVRMVKAELQKLN